MQDGTYSSTVDEITPAAPSLAATFSPTQTHTYFS